MSILIFSIGPVQGFISQSRRTADGWVGSYLISYLAGHVIAQFRELGADVIEPETSGVSMYSGIVAQRTNKTLADHSLLGDTTIAALPNTILIDCKNAEPQTLGSEGEKAARTAWHQLKRTIHDILFPSIIDSPLAQEIWTRQVDTFWEFYWAWGDNPSKAYNNLAARKGLRNFAPNEEKGDRCTVCGQREALWDETTKLPKHRQARNTAKDNWRGWGEKLNSANLGLDKQNTPRNLFEEDGKERLCAICLIKRLVPWTPNSIRSIWSAGKTSSRQPSVFPSTSTMATVLWRTELLGQSLLYRNLFDYWREIGPDKHGGDPPRAFESWGPAADLAEARGLRKAHDIIRMDGDWYLYGEAVKREQKLTSEEHERLKRLYAALRDASIEAGAGAPPIYWALVSMDGDKMGDFIEKAQAAGIETREISALLNQFAQTVPEIVRAHNGRVIFAGGDDVLAFLPLETALGAADELRWAFFCKFAQWLDDKKQAQPGNSEKTSLPVPTLSGSIVYAHHQAPLSLVLRSGQTLLKAWAKDKANRNALVMQQFQRGGPSLTFAAKWTFDNGLSLKERLENMIQPLRDRELSRGFGHSLREIEWMFAETGPLNAHKADQIAYLAYLLAKSRLDEEVENRARDFKQVAGEMLSLCQAAVGEGPTRGFSTEPLLMARFLAGGGREER